jgi:hypothetical protein
MAVSVTQGVLRGAQKMFPAMKVPRHCPLVLLVQVRTFRDGALNKARRWEVGFVVNRGEELSRDFTAHDQDYGREG